jgi:hypothetical protein
MRRPRSERSAGIRGIDASVSSSRFAHQEQSLDVGYHFGQVHRLDKVIVCSALQTLNGPIALMTFGSNYDEQMANGSRKPVI